MMSDTDLGIRTLLTVVFVCAAVAKLRSPAARSGFRASLDELAWLPVPTRTPLALAVPLGELAISALLWVPGVVPGRLGYLASSGLLAAFTVAYGVPMLRGRRIQCACFGAKAESPMSVAHLVLNGLLIVAAVVGLSGGVRFSYGDIHAARAIAACGAAVFAALVIVLWDDLVFLVRGPVPAER
jgi:hypothetical protein